MGEYTTETGEFDSGNGVKHPTISIFKGRQLVIGFGLTKALGILASIKEIEAFVAANSKEVA
jgi:hypothetical protein